MRSGGGVGPHRRWRAILACALALGSCTKGTPGKRLASGLARDLTVAPGGGLVAFLQGAAHPGDRSIPADLLVGDLQLAPTSGDRPAERVGGGVPTLPGAWSFSTGGEWLALLAAWRFRAGEGELWLATSPGAPRKVADGVSSMVWGPSGAMLAFVAQGRLMVLDASKEPAAPSLVLDGVQSFAWSPEGKRLAGRASTVGGGRVDLVQVPGGRPREVAQASSDFAFGAEGELYVLGVPGPKGGDRPLIVLGTADARPREIGRATSFASWGKDVALLSTEKQPGEAFGSLSRVPRSGGPAQALGERVSEFRFGQRGDLVFLARYDPRARAGTLMVAPPGGGPQRAIAQKVQSFLVQGARVLYLEQAPQKGDFKIELWTAQLDSPAAPRKVDEGVYGYQLAPDGQQLFWKARCAGGPRSCSLFRGPLDGSAPAQLFAPDVAGFELSDDASRILVEQPHRGAARAVDLAVIAADAPPREEPPRPVAVEVDPTSRFTDPRGRRIVYAAMAAAQAGVYVLDVP